MASSTSTDAHMAEMRMYKYVHEMSPEERLASLKEWAEDKKHVQPGEAGTIAFNGLGGLKSLANGGAMPYQRSKSRVADPFGGQYDAPVGPPSYSVATNGEPDGAKPKGALQKWLEKRKEKKATKRRESAPAYFP